MAGHSQYKNIMHRKGAQDKKKAKIFSKIAKEIMVIVKMYGSGDNPKLRDILAIARHHNVPKDNIERAIQNAMDTNNKQNFEFLRYGASGPNGIMLLIEALTDNKNRTVSDVKNILNKAGFTMVNDNNILFLFDKIGYIECGSTADVNTLISAPINIEDISEETQENGARIVIVVTTPEEFSDTYTYINHSISGSTGSIIWRPKDAVEITPVIQEKFIHLLDTLDECEDVQDVFHNVSFQ